MRSSLVLKWKVPKNLSVAPRYDVWNAKYEPWAHMKRMGKLVGTGFYIPPEWYNHFRMFPPIHHNFQQEETLNPQNASEPTQIGATTTSAERLRLRDELARKSRSVASEGMRYYNLFWIQKPLDAMERQYFRLKKSGIPHDVAVKKVLQEFYDNLAVKKRVATIQSEEAKLSGGFISMREAMTVLNVLSHLQKEQVTPHQVATLATDKLETSRSGSVLTGVVERVKATAVAAASAATATTSTDASAASASPATSTTMSAESLSAMLQDEEAATTAASTISSYTVKVSPAADDNLPKLRETATDHSGVLDWFDMGLEYDISTPDASSATKPPAL